MKIINRSAWGARYPNGFAPRPMPVREFWLHHSVTIAPDLVPPFTDDDAAVRTLERIGQSSFGGGISYTYPITPVGRIYEGHSLERRGAHTGGHNTVAAAFCFVGNYENMRPTTAQKRAVAQQMVDLHRAGKATRHTLNGGHRDTGFATACPGRHAYAAIREINALANAIWAGRTPPVTVGDADWTPTGKWSVKKIQTELDLQVDGNYGPATEKAVKELQKALDLTADGLWGPTTEGAVMSLQDDIAKIAADVKELKTEQKKIPGRVWAHQLDTPKSVLSAFPWFNKKFTAGGSQMYNLFSFGAKDDTDRILKAIKDDQ